MASFVSRYLDWAMTCTSAPELYHRGVAYSLLAAVLKRQVWLDLAGGRLYPNLWVCLLGDSGALHKSTAINIGVRVLRGFDVLYPSDFSLQRLYDTMKARPQGTLIYREFRALVDLLSRDYMAGARATLTDVYDCPPSIEYDTKTSGLVQVPDPSLCILSASTVRWFTDRNTLKDIEGGFLARFLFLPAWLCDCGPEEALPPGEEATTAGRDQLGAELRNAAYARGKMHLSEGAAVAYRVWHGGHRSKSPFLEGPFNAFLVRFETLVLKLAMLDHIATGRDTREPVLPTSVWEGQELVDECEKRLAHLLQGEVAFTPHQEMRRRILAIVPNGGSEISQRDLIRAMRCKLKDLLDVKQALLAEEVIGIRMVKVQGGTNTFWRKL